MMPIAQQLHVADYPGMKAHVLAICGVLLPDFDIIGQ